MRRRLRARRRRLRARRPRPCARRRRLRVCPPERPRAHAPPCPRRRSREPPPAEGPARSTRHRSSRHEGPHEGRRTRARQPLGRRSRGTRRVPVRRPWRSRAPPRATGGATGSWQPHCRADAPARRRRTPLPGARRSRERTPRARARSTRGRRGARERGSSNACGSFQSPLPWRYRGRKGPRSHRQPMTPLEPSRLQDRPAGARGHAVAEAVALRPLARVGLVGSLHVDQPFAASTGIDEIDAAGAGPRTAGGPGGSPDRRPMLRDGGFPH